MKQITVRFVAALSALVVGVQFANADECDDQIPAVVAASGATVIRKTELGRYHMRHPLLSELVVSCVPLSNYVAATFDGAFPPPAYFELIAKIGEVHLKEKSALIRAGAEQCHRLAQRSKTELGDTKTSNTVIDCQSFKRDGGGTIVSVFRK